MKSHDWQHINHQEPNCGKLSLLMVKKREAFVHKGHSFLHSLPFLPKTTSLPLQVLGRLGSFTFEYKFWILFLYFKSFYVLADTSSLWIHCKYIFLYSLESCYNSYFKIPLGTSSSTHLGFSLS